MADLLAKKLNNASRLVDAVDRMMRGLYDAAQADAEIASAGLTYDDADFTGTSLAHLTATDLSTARTNVAAIKAALEAAFQDDVLNKVRP
jgi:hypothetical protein